MTPLAKKVFELFGKPELVAAMEEKEAAEASASSLAPGQDTARPRTEETRPYLNDRGELIIPFACDPKYRWWAGGQSIAQTLLELNASPEVWRRYVGAYTETVQ